MHKPFAVLEDLVREGRITLSRSVRVRPPAPTPKLPEGLSDCELLVFAMEDVTALGWSAVPLHPRAPLEIQPQNDEEEALRALEEFLRSGDEQIGEYIEGATHPAGRLYLDDLRSGRFSV